MQPVTIKVDENEYQILQAHTLYWKKWVYAHFNFRRSRGIEPEPIVAGMYDRYFTKLLSDIKFPYKGKTLNLDYSEAKAFFEVTCTANDLPTIGVRALIDKALTDWKPSLSKKSMKDWYQTNEMLIEKFGKYDELQDDAFEVVNEYYNQNYL